MIGASLQSGTPTFLPSMIGGDPPLKTPSAQESQFAASAQAHDKTTQAALAFFQATDNTTIKAAFDHLLAIVFNSRGSLFLKEPGLTEFEATHEFLEAWLVDKLMPYSASGTCYDAAARGEFRYLVKNAHFALIDELRKRERSDDALDGPTVRMDAAIDTNEGEAHSWHDLLGAEGVCPLGTKPSLEPSVLQQRLQQSRDEITKKLGAPLFHVLSVVCGLFPDQLSLGDVTRGIAKARAVSEQTARKLHHALARKLISLRGDPVVWGLVEIIRSAGDPIHLSTDTWDAQSQGFAPN